MFNLIINRYQSDWLINQFLDQQRNAEFSLNNLAHGWLTNNSICFNMAKLVLYRYQLFFHGQNRSLDRESARNCVLVNFLVTCELWAKWF